MKILTFRQFNHPDHRSFIYYYIRNIGDHRAQYRNGPDLYGWSDHSNNIYTNSFQLELIYD